jgi:hypothetical protein
MLERIRSQFIDEQTKNYSALNVDFARICLDPDRHASLIRSLATGDVRA